jgi:alcohol dehydrogenase class IV
MNHFWQFATSGSVRFGRGSLNTLASEVVNRRLQRPVIVMDSTIESLPQVQKAITTVRSVAKGCSVFAGGEPEPSLEVAESAIEVARVSDADSVIGIGGGSNLDIAKIVAVVLTHGGRARDFFGFGKVPGPIMPLIAIPTTAGTGSEVSHSAVLTDTIAQVKVSTLSPFLRPTLALIDSSLTDSCPAKVTAHSGIDALVHAIEALTNRPNEQMHIAADNENESTVYEPRAYEGSYSFTSMLALEAIRNIQRCLVRAVETPSDRDARDGMAYAAMLAGMAFSNSGVGLVHALEYPIGALTHCSHGEGNGLLLPYVMEFNKPMCPSSMIRIASILTGQPEDGCSCEDAIVAIQKLQTQIGIRSRLRDLGLKREQIDQVAEKAIQIERLMLVTARRPTLDDLKQILSNAW